MNRLWNMTTYFVQQQSFYITFNLEFALAATMFVQHEKNEVGLLYSTNKPL
jgi:hypothetical protein